MRMIPVKTKPALRAVQVKMRMWEIWLRMKRLDGDFDFWYSEWAAPTDNSPWGLTRAHEHGLAPLGSGRVIHVVEAEGNLRLDAAHDFFGVLRAATRTRSVYSLYVMCRATIEACAFATWVFDPEAEPAERLLRGLLLRQQSLKTWLKSLQKETDPPEEFDADYLEDITRAKGTSETHLGEIEHAIEAIRADPRSMSGPQPKKPPRPTQRVREMLISDIGMPQGSDAYHRLSGIVHAEATAIFGTWNTDRRRPSIDYYSFLVYLHLAVSSIAFSMGERAACWGATHKDTRLHKIIDRIERIIQGEPNVQMV